MQLAKFQVLFMPKKSGGSGVELPFSGRDWSCCNLEGLRRWILALHATTLVEQESSNPPSLMFYLWVFCCNLWLFLYILLVYIGMWLNARWTCFLLWGFSLIASSEQCNTPSPWIHWWSCGGVLQCPPSLRAKFRNGSRLLNWSLAPWKTSELSQQLLSPRLNCATGWLTILQLALESLAKKLYALWFPIWCYVWRMACR